MPFFRRRRQHKRRVPYARATPITSSHTTSTKAKKVPENDKGLFDNAKLNLMISAFLLLCGEILTSFITSIIACYVIHNATFESVKNWELTSGASWFSLKCSGIALFNQWCLNIIDKEKAYTIYTLCYIGARSWELCGGVLI